MRSMIDILGVDGYASLCILISASAWFLLMDLGIGTSLQNYLSELGENPAERARLQYTAGFMLTAIALALSVIILVFHEDFANLILPSTAKTTVQSRVDGALCGMFLSIFISAGTAASKIWYAEHRGFIPVSAGAAATLTSLALVEILLLLGRQVSLLVGCLIYFGPPLLIMLYGLFFKTGLIKASLSWNTGSAKALLKRGRYFWLFSAAATLTLQIDNLVLGKFAATGDIVAYNIAIKIVYAGLTFYSLALGLLHPHLAESLHQKKLMTASRQLSQIIGLGLIFWIFAAVGIFFLSEQIMQFMSPGLPPPNLAFKLLLIFYVFIRVWTDAHTVVLMSASKMESLVISTFFHGMSSLSLMLVLVPSWGAHGVLLAFLGSYLLTNSWYTPYLCRKVLGVRFFFHLAAPELLLRKLRNDQLHD